MAATTEFTTQEARRVASALGVDWKKVDFEQFKMGLNVELEHGRRDPQTNVTEDDEIMTAKIVLAHLKLIPDYYTRLAQMEAVAEAERIVHG